jgi:hypothetical protein
LDAVASWFRSEVCSRVQLKVPDTRAEDAAYNSRYTLLAPSVHVMFTAPRDRARPGLLPAPSVTLLAKRVVENADSVLGVDVEALFLAWDPGLHEPDQWERTSVDGMLVRPDQPEAYARSADGWRDAWHFASVAARALRQTRIGVGGVALDTSQPIEYGPAADQSGVIDLWPFWAVEMSFSILGSAPDTHRLDAGLL